MIGYTAKDPLKTFAIYFYVIKLLEDQITRNYQLVSAAIFLFLTRFGY